MLGGKLLDADALRSAAGFSGRPKWPENRAPDQSPCQTAPRSGNGGIIGWVLAVDAAGGARVVECADGQHPVAIAERRRKNGGPREATADNRPN